MENREATPPAISIILAIAPSIYKQGEDVPNLDIKATLTSKNPITIFSWSTVLNPKLALKRRNFTAHDLSTSPPSYVNLEITKGPQRSGFQRRKGHVDEQWFLTLFPDTPITISHPLNIVRRTRHEHDGKDMFVFLPEHEYRLAVSENEVIKTWWWGTVDDVLADEEGSEKDVDGIQGGSPIRVRAEAADFKIV